MRNKVSSRWTDKATSPCRPFNKSACWRREYRKCQNRHPKFHLNRIFPTMAVICLLINNAGKSPGKARTKRPSSTRNTPWWKCWHENGRRIEMLEEVSGVSSPDITIDGVKAELKKLSSANNIERHAKETINK